jgi:arylsulfatase A-like enzyme
MKKQAKVILLGTIIVGLVLGGLYYYLNKNKPLSKEDLKDYNLIIVVSDALRWDVLGCYGGNAQTPNIDWLASRGVLFENAYSTAPTTLPASVSMFTGNYSRVYGILLGDKADKPNRRYCFYVNDNDKLFGEMLSELGYQVMMDVENPLAKRSNNLQGFKEFRRFGQMKKEEAELVKKRTGIGSPKDYRYGRLYDLLHYLLTLSKKQKFFILKWFLDPHGTYNPPEKYKKKISIDKSRLTKKESFYSQSYVKDFKKALRKKNLTEYEIYYIKELYKAEVEFIDERVGLIIEALKQGGILEKTIIVFTSDHGELFGEHGRLGHGFDYYENLVHIPLIISGPGVLSGKRDKTFISLLDLIATLVDLMGQRSSSGMQGTSYCQLLQGGAVENRTLYFDRIANDLTQRNDSDAVMMDGYKLIWNWDKEKRTYHFKLYNIIDDPKELKDIYPKKPQILPKMLKALMDLRKENRTRLKHNIEKIDKNVNLDKEFKKTIKELKTMGYID